VKKPDILENRAKCAYLSLGSNLGNRNININKAKILLINNGIKIIKCSKIYETESWPNKKLPKYLNIVIKIYTLKAPFELFKILKIIENKLGRKMSKKNSPRTCDIDILDFDQKLINIKKNNCNLTIPHPRLHLRNFVLIPLFDIMKDWKHPKLNVDISRLLSKIKPHDLRSIKII
jgi:2-amino-4-hydroxy-6-hydroxymethyldihydropteridine diphosphokinase